VPSSHIQNEKRSSSVERDLTHVQTGRVRHADPDLGHDGRPGVAVDVRHVPNGSGDRVLNGGDGVTAPGGDPRARQDGLQARANRLGF
jgi:hypothetical protein